MRRTMEIVGRERMKAVPGKFCILIPAHNCSMSLPELLPRITLAGPHDEIIVVDDASSDSTFEVAARYPRVVAYRNDIQRRYGGTSRRLYEIALERGADYTINIHGDLGHRPEDISILRDAILVGKGDIVLGSRLLYILNAFRQHGLKVLFNKELRGGMPLIRVIGHIGLTGYQNFCFGTKYHSFHEGMRASNRKAIEWVVRQELPSWYDFDTELIILAHQAGLRISEVIIPPSYDHKAASSAPPLAYGARVFKHASAHLLRRLK
jgi:glycosyltransferase involved in cell wall biosynthesis